MAKRRFYNQSDKRMFPRYDNNPRFDSRTRNYGPEAGMVSNRGYNDRSFGDMSMTYGDYSNNPNMRSKSARGRSRTNAIIRNDEMYYNDEGGYSSDKFADRYTDPRGYYGSDRYSDRDGYIDHRYSDRDGYYADRNGYYDRKDQKRYDRFDDLYRQDRPSYYGRKADMRMHSGYGDHLIGEDRTAPALLPRRVIEDNYDSPYNYMGDNPADLYMGVQNQLRQDGRDMRRIFKPGKY